MGERCRRKGEIRGEGEKGKIGEEEEEMEVTSVKINLARSPGSRSKMSGTSILKVSR